MSLDAKITKALVKIGNYYVQELRNKIIEEDRVASHDLVRSISSKPMKNVVKVTANRYLEAISEGKKASSKNPSPQMVSRIITSMKFKGLKPKGSRSISETAYKKSAFAIAKSINRSSWEGSDLIKRAFYAIEENIDYELSEAFKAEIQEIINNINKKQE